jgi:hypothetical protein
MIWSIHLYKKYWYSRLAGTSPANIFVLPSKTPAYPHVYCFEPLFVLFFRDGVPSLASHEWLHFNFNNPAKFNLFNNPMKIQQ